MRLGDGGRRDPFAALPIGKQALDSEEPMVALGLAGATEGLIRRPRAGGRKTPVRPAERRRAGRRISVTFSTEDIPGRLRALAVRWGLVAPDGKSPHVSAVVEYLLRPQIEAAERGEICSPEGG